MASRALSGSITLVALMLASFAWAVASSSAGGDVRSDAASPGRCSLAEANAVVERLHLNDGLVVAKPVNRVLCGPFLGPGSNAMVASLSRETCLPNFGWAVFRFAGGAWQLVMKRDGFAIVSKAGSDIQEEVPIFRSGDPHCIPSGGTKTRLWHWNGSRFVVGPWQVTKAKVDQPTGFRSPSGNITCWMYDGSSPKFSRDVVCSTDTPPQFVILTVDGRLKVRKMDSGCGCDEPDPPRLAYGKQITVGRFRCVSEEIGVTCTVIKSGKGFLINRDGVSRVGP